MAAAAGVKGGQHRRAVARPEVDWAARAPDVAVASLVATWSAVFGFLCWRQESRWAPFGYDTGLHDQGIWLTAHGLSTFDTIRGMDYWGHHVNLVSLLFVVPYRLGAGIHLLTLVHTLWLGAAAIPLWWLAKDRMPAHRWAPVAVPLAYLLHPALSWIAWWLYHPDSMAITPLCFAWWFATRRAGPRWGWFAVSVGFALACKEDIALAVLGLGLALVLVRRRRAGLLTAGAGVAWFLFATKVVIPARSDGPPFYESFFPALGTDLSSIIRNSLLHPSRVLHLAGRHKSYDYALKMLGPLGFVLPVLGGPVLLLGLPQTTVNVLVQVQDGATIKSQYATLPLVALLLGLTEGLGLIARRPQVLRPVAGLLVASSLVGAHLWGLSPIGRDYHSGIWAEHQRPNIAELEAAKAAVPKGDGVSTTYNIVAQFTHRRYAYEFPNPWISVNYGFKGQTGDPATVQWLVLERGALDGAAAALAATLTGPTGDFAVVSDDHGVLLAHRWRPSTVDQP